ncbi:hypothetical protein [Anaeromyxobacter oryzae]|uniref:Uncharacterized protein n=1 Tax=Anaeromyxobacter oryzae TaxID=2918170 RepID=A0ABM7X2H3_9BACT|nr:hypothetical protein [Anaeromyxobacter oryzae]BDG05984.1 hypothetical protein AMOR_49800 [Anaeromyxobacter oryzae]
MRRLVIVGAGAIFLFSGVCILIIAIATDPDRSAAPVAPVRTRAAVSDGPLQHAPPDVATSGGLAPIPTYPVPAAYPPPAAPPDAASPADGSPLPAYQAERAVDPATYRDRRRAEMLDSLNRRRARQRTPDDE